MIRSEQVQRAAKTGAEDRVICIPVHAPANPAAPNIFVQHARQVGQCDGTIVFDAGAVRSLAGPRPIQFLWTLGGRSASGVLLPLRTDRIALNESVLRIPREALLGTTVAVDASLTVTNFLGASGNRTYTTLVNTTALPDIQIQYPPLVRRSDTSEMVARATLPTCVGAVEPSFVFHWYVRAKEEEQEGVVVASHDNFEWVDVHEAKISGKERAFVNVKGFHFTDKRRAALSARPFTWLPCRVYEMKAVVDFASRGNAFVSNFQTAVVRQTRGKVHAIIDALDMIVTVNQAVTLNASSSYDEDGLAPDVNLTFAWKCTTVPGGKPCNVGIANQTSDTLFVRPGSLPPRSRMKVSVTVSSDAHPVFPCYPKKPRRATDWVVITVANVPAPDVRVQVCATPVCASPSPLVQGRAVVNFRPGQSYYLRMNADMPVEDPSEDHATAKCGDTLESYWMSSIDAHNAAASINTKPLTKPHPLPPSGIEIFKFTLSHSQSTAVGTSYKFTMKLTAECDLSDRDVQSVSKVEFNIDINSPPQSGRLMVTSTGTSKPTAARTIFHLHHENKWVDPHFPLRYYFGFVANDRNASTFSSQTGQSAGAHPNLIYLEESPRSSDSLFTRLPMPGECPHREITVVVQVGEHV